MTRHQYGISLLVSQASFRWETNEREISAVLSGYNRPSYRYGSHIEFIRFKEYCGMPREHLLSIYARFSGQKTTSMYISREKAIIITSKHGTTIFFSYYNLFLGKLKEKLARKARVNTEASISDRAHAPEHPHYTP